MRDNLLRGVTFVIMLWWATFLAGWVAYVAMLCAVVYGVVFEWGQVSELLFSAAVIWLTVLAVALTEPVRKAHEEVWASWKIDR